MSQKGGGSAAAGANGNRHSGKSADAPVVIGDLHVPDPRGPASVARPRSGVDMAIRDRPEEGGVIRLPDGHHVIRADSAVGCGGGEALRERGEDPSVNDSEGLQMALMDLDPRTRV